MITLTEPVADLLRRTAAEVPDKPAIIDVAADVTVTYRELDERSDAIAAGFAERKIGRGTMVPLMVAGVDMYTLLVALAKVGAVAVFVDPGMGLERMMHCVRTAQAEAFIGVPAAHLARIRNPSAFERLRMPITVGRRWFWGGATYRELLASTGPVPDTSAIEPQDLFIVPFTSGSTGPPKGVEYTQRNATAALSALTEIHGRTRDDVSLVTMPLYGFFDLMLGSTVVVAPVNPGQIATADPVAVLAAIHRYSVTAAVLSPALMTVLATHCETTGIRLPDTLRSLVGTGGPVPYDLAARVVALLPPTASVSIMYAATEALPIAAIDWPEIERETRALSRAGSGTCLGHPTEGVEVRILAIADGSVAAMTDDVLAAPGEVGEIVIAGPTVTQSYLRRPEANSAAKIIDGEQIWHRVGDLGRFDDAGRLWFYGRMSERVRTPGGPLFTVQCEEIMNGHPDVARTALVGVGETPVLCFELRDGVRDSETERVAGELAVMASEHPATESIERFLRHEGFPTDIRHNAKIGRGELATWAAGHEQS